MHELDACSGRLAAPVWVWKIMITDAASVRFVVFAETVNVDCSTPDESILIAVGDTEPPEIVGSPLGHPPAGQNFTVEAAILELALPSVLLRTSVNVTYCEPAPNAGVPPAPMSDNDQLMPSPDNKEYCVGNAATLPSGWVVNVFSVTYT